MSDLRGILIGYQSKWLEDESRVSVWEKSRRIGASWADALKSVLKAGKKKPDGGMNCFYLSYNKDMTRQYIQDCAEWARKISAAASEVEEIVLKDKDRDITIFQIRFASGHIIQALPSEARNLRSKQGRVIIDEAAFVDDLNELLKAALALLMWGGQVAVLSTHNGEDNPFNEMINDIRAGRKAYSLHRTDFDQALEQGLFRAVCRAQGRDYSVAAEAAFREEMIRDYGDGADEELFCIPSKGSGVFLSRALIEACMRRDLPVIRYSQPAEFVHRPDQDRISEVEAWCEDNLAPHLQSLESRRRSYLGVDFGRSGDLSVDLPLVEKQDATFESPFILELRNIPFQQQEQILVFVVDRLPRFSHGALDARGNGQYLAERAMQKYGDSRISQVTASETWYRENMPPLKAAFEDLSIALPFDADVIDDLRAFKMIRGVARIPEIRTRGADQGQRHGDAGIAAAMAWFATRQDGGGPVEYERVERKRDYEGY